MPTEPLPSFDVREIPFSRRGSWLDLSPVVGLHRTADDIHLVSHVTGMHAVLALVPLREGDRIECTLTADPTLLTWKADGQGTAEAVFESTTALRLRGRGMDVRITDATHSLTSFTGSYLLRDPQDGSYIFTSYETGRRYRVTSLSGSIDAIGDQALGEADRSLTISGMDGWEVVIEQIDAARTPYTSVDDFEAIVERAATDFRAYVDAIAPWRTNATPAATLACYVLWSATVAPGGFLGRESVLMSKHWMDKLWSWDHAFNALALAPGLTDLALDQFLAPFDHQDKSGAMPDSIAHSEVLYNFVKPPIHGWALARLRERLPRDLTHGELIELYDRISSWTRFWLDHRRAPGHALPYYQHGNDSGWDNSTAFDHDRVIEAPDLAAFLVIQIDVLAQLSDELDTGDGDAWREAGRGIRDALLDELHDDAGFFAVGALSGRIGKRSSLLTLLPILASPRLPEDVIDQLARGIEAHLTEWGLATQLLDSAEYESDGYWRGPIWAPATLLIEDGLRAAGRTELAALVSARFRALCERSGFAENFDAVTGEGLRDRAYTWTASVYLVLAGNAAREGAGPGQG
ncbi:amylo-alpha-1,6-glucosidase [Microbacterium rhizomatis]|uniref:Glycogen debranching protein n=1 Tax=Microbacterium rhizomatis TaxID=1631477 RepID=A0A5J5J3U0_9MICO|nr:glycogen debranching protein [Microbacterium rhizomatis]KAA9110662.1 glycogen debranching protein [Microbacterium rhizomatis]